MAGCDDSWAVVDRRCDAILAGGTALGSGAGQGRTAAGSPDDPPVADAPYQQSDVLVRRDGRKAPRQ